MEKEGRRRGNALPIDPDQTERKIINYSGISRTQKRAASFLAHPQGKKEPLLVRGHVPKSEGKEVPMPP